MGRRRVRGARQETWRAVVLVGLLLAVSTACLPLGVKDTATGTRRTGLTKANLIKLTSLDAAHLSLGLNPSSPASTGSAHYDIAVTLLNNGTPVASGLRRCVGGLGTGSPSHVTVPWNSFGPQTLHVGDVLSLRISARFGTDATGAACDAAPPVRSPGLRVYYDSMPNGSRFAATITPDPSVDLFLHASGAACDAAGPAVSNRLLRQDLPAGPGRGVTTRAISGLTAGNPFQDVATWDLPPQCDCANQFIPEVRDNPPAPAPEPVSVSELPLPPTAPSDTAGSCTTAVNPHNTGCISAKAFSPQGSQTSVLNNGNFVDNNHVVATVIFTGAPAAPNPASIYNGIQLIVVKADGTTFANGDPWKCITCGLDPSHKQGISTDFSYPQAYTDRTQNPPKPSVLDGQQHRAVLGALLHRRDLHAGGHVHLSHPLEPARRRWRCGWRHA